MVSSNAAAVVVTATQTGPSAPGITPSAAAASMGPTAAPTLSAAVAYEPAMVGAPAAASTRLSAVGRFGRRKARAEHQAAKEQTQTQRARVRDNWGSAPPRNHQALPGWAAQTAAQKAKGDPRVAEAARAADAARTDRGKTSRRHKQERFALLAREIGTEQARSDQFGMRTVNPQRAARDALTRATLARAEADELRNLSVNDAARIIAAKRAEQEQTRRLLEQRERQLNPFQRTTPGSDPGRDGPARGL